MLSKGGNNEILATWGEGNDPNASVFGALDPADQALRDEAIDKDTDRAWGQIDDWADGIEDRKSVVEGQGKSVDLGVRRIIKENNDDRAADRFQRGRIVDFASGREVRD